MSINRVMPSNFGYSRDIVDNSPQKANGCVDQAATNGEKSKNCSPAELGPKQPRVVSLRPETVALIFKIEN